MIKVKHKKSFRLKKEEVVRQWYLIDATDQTLRIEINGISYAKFFINGAWKATINLVTDSSGNSQNMPDDEFLRPITTHIGSADVVNSDYILAVGDRG